MGVNSTPFKLTITCRMADSEELELGDYVVILGGSLNKTKGKLYEFSEDQFSILPSGATDRIIKIKIVDGNPDPDLGITEIKLLKKSPRPGFIHLVDLRVGQTVETFLEGPVAGPKFKVVSLNEEEDSAVFEDEAGEEVTLEFGFSGIPRDLGYEVIRTLESPVPESVVPSEAEAEAQLEVAVDEQDVEEYGQVQSAQEEDEDKEQQEARPAFLIGEEIELPEHEDIQEVGSAFRVYQDVFQRSEMLGQLIRALPQVHQRNPIKLQEVRRQVELMLLMRNDVVQYGITGEPLGKVKPQSMNTLAELVSRSDVSLVRKVVDVSKVLYIDHSEEHMMAVKAGKDGSDQAAGPVGDDAEGLYLDYLADVVRAAEVLDKASSIAIGEGEPSIGMPKFFLDMETYRQKIQTPYRFQHQGASSSGLSAPLAQDEEAFRLEIPELDPKSYTLNVLSGELASKDEDLVPPPPPVSQAAFALVRMLKPRIGRFTSAVDNSQEYRTVESGENPSFNTVLVFPMRMLRDLGPIRSGSLANDISLGMTIPTLMDDILEEVDGISDYPTAHGVLLLGVNGSTVGNILVRDWLASLDMRQLSGIGDTLTTLRGYGSLNIEWSIEQIEVIQQKIEQNLAALRIFMTRQREENATVLANLKFDPQPLLPAPQTERLLARIESEPLLQKVVQKVRDYMGELADIDTNWFAYVFIEYPDLLLAALGQQPDTLTRQRLLHVRAQFNESLNLGYRIKQKLLLAGSIPQENLCPHVKELEDVRKMGHRHAEEPRDTTKMKGLLKVLNRFRGKVDEEWVWCNKCPQHLVCAHELLQVQEFLRPKEKDAIQKELILKFSGGQFGGQFICRVCGQGIQQLEFDTSIEFDDAGRPMMGRATLVDEEAIAEEALDALLSGPTKEEEQKVTDYGTEELNQIYKTIQRITGLVGINPEKKDFDSMVNELYTYISGLASREAYAHAAKGKKVQEYDIWYSIRYISMAAAIVLLNIQSRLPDYIIYYTSAECKDGFFGYPLEAESNQSGILCVTTVIAGINDNEFPWNLTPLQKQSNLIKRRDAILPFVKNQVDALMKFPIHQAAIQAKKEYRIRLYGSAEGIKRDQISSNFRPVPYLESTEEAAKAPIIEDAASPDKKAVAWIRKAHMEARLNAALNPDSPYSETTCCLHPVTQPVESFASLPAFPKRDSTQKANPRSATVTTTFYTEKPKVLEGKIDSKDYYKLFAKLCYQGDAKGKPHELGIGLQCSECGLQFQEVPELNYVVGDKESKEDAGMKLKTHIEAQGIVIDETTFNDLLQKSRQLQAIESSEPRRVLDNSLELLLAHPAASFDTWPVLLQTAYRALNELGSTSAGTSAASLTKIQIATAAEDLVKEIADREESVKGRLNPATFAQIESMCRRTPRECGESAGAYLLLPFQRWIKGVSISNYFILKSYDLSSDTQNDILQKGMGQHLQPLGGGEELSGIALLKVKAFIQDMSSMCRFIFPVLRAQQTPGGKEMVQYLQRAYIFGAMKKFLDPHHIPVDSEDSEDSESLEGTIPNMKLLYKALSQALMRYSVGSKIPSEEEIRNRLEQRAEQEKQVFISKLDRMTREERKVELVLKNLGMGDWAAGGSKAIRQYDKDRYEVERAERAAAGISDYAVEPVAQVFDMFGLVAPETNADDGGYDHEDMAEDDY